MQSIQTTITSVVNQHHRPLCKLLLKSILFTIITVPSYFHISSNQEINVDYPFSAYSSIAFFIIDTLFLIEIPLMLLAINSFLVWSVNKSRTDVINFLDITCIIWVMACFLTCLNFPNSATDTSKVFNRTNWKDWLAQSYNRIVDNVKVYLYGESYYASHSIRDTNHYEKPVDEIEIENPTIVGRAVADNSTTQDDTYHYLPDKQHAAIHITGPTPVGATEKAQSAHDSSPAYNKQYESLLLIINGSFTVWIVVVLLPSLKQNVIDYFNDHLYTIIGSFGASSMLIVPHHYHKRVFRWAFGIMALGFCIKLLFILHVVSIDLATGLFHLFVAIACQLCSQLIV